MIHPIVYSSEPIILVGAGEASRADLDLALTLSDRVVAVDGGASLVLGAGIEPEAVIGDFDSLPDGVREVWPKHLFHYVQEQDSTDFEKALERVHAPLLIGVGFTGGRTDHQLAALHGMLQFAHVACVLIAQQDLIFHAPPLVTVPLTAGDTVSLFPLRAVTGRSKGLEWPIKGLAFAPGVKSGTSNRAVGGDVTLEMDSPGMITILPRRSFGAVTQALSQAEGLASNAAPWPGPSRWPARGA